MCILPLCGLLSSLVLPVGCSLPSPVVHDYKLYPGPVRPISELAVLQVAESTWIDGLRANLSDWRTVQVAPGRHRIRWHEREWGDSPLLEVELFAGRTYSLNTGWVKSELVAEGRHDGHWIQDEASGWVVAGTRP